MKRTWISGMHIPQIEERHEVFRNLNWESPQTPPYSVHIFENEDNTAGIIATSDSFGGRIGWAHYKGANPLIGAVSTKFDKDEIEFLKRKYPKFLAEVESL